MVRETEVGIPDMRAERDDYRTTALAVVGDIAVRAGMARDGVKELLDAIAGSQPFHPVGEWIESAAWDGIDRLPEFHESFVLADQSKSKLRAGLLDPWCLSAVGAIYETNGIAAQGMLVLVGAQGANKTRKFLNLCPVAGAVRSGITLNVHDKDSIFQATSAWIVECGEFESTLRRSELAAFKAFITRNEDVLRRPYAKVDNTYRRRTIFGGTVNFEKHLDDSTGTRRFWAQAITTCTLLEPAHMQQIWAQYLHLYRHGQRWHLDEPTKLLLQVSNEDHNVIDPLLERVQAKYDWSRVDGEGWQKRCPVLWLSATQISIALGILTPTSAQATRVGTLVGTLNCRVSRRSNGLKLLALPPMLRG
jgi:putative DNA primase/helicase